MSVKCNVQEICDFFLTRPNFRIEAIIFAQREESKDNDNILKFLRPKIPIDASDREFLNAWIKIKIVLSEFSYVPFYPSDSQIVSISDAVKLHIKQKRNTGENMNKVDDTPLKELTLVFGVDVSTMTEQDCLNALRRIDKEMKELDAFDYVDSRYISKKLEELDNAKDVIITKLDSFVK